MPSKAVFAAAASALALAAPAAAQQAPTPLFATDSVLRLTLRAPFDELVRAAPEESPRVSGTLAVAGTSETLPVTLSPRGITRRQKDVCQFPPLRVQFAGRQASGLFAGQDRLKLVAHCRPQGNFQQYVLLEYAAYRLYNALTPLSFRVRLAQVDYTGPSGKVTASRYGFFIEDPRDLAARNGLREAPVGSRIPVPTLSPADSARYAVFQYLISNLDWAMQAGPEGETCCHNGRLLAPPAAATPLIPVPYDFDFAGFVDAPYAVPPDAIRIKNVKVRRYRGFCRHNAQALAAAAAIRGRGAEMQAIVAATPGLDPKAANRAQAFLAKGFEDIATDQSVREKLLSTCVG